MLILKFLLLMSTPAFSVKVSEFFYKTEMKQRDYSNLDEALYYIENLDPSNNYREVIVDLDQQNNRSKLHVLSLTFILYVRSFPEKANLFFIGKEASILVKGSMTIEKTAIIVDNRNKGDTVFILSGPGELKFKVRL